MLSIGALDTKTKNFPVCIGTDLLRTFDPQKLCCCAFLDDIFIVVVIIDVIVVIVAGEMVLEFSRAMLGCFSLFSFDQDLF